MIQKNPAHFKPGFQFLAEKEGFEPPVPCDTTVFKTAAFDRSAISPGAKVLSFLNFQNSFKKNILNIICKTLALFRNFSII